MRWYTSDWHLSHARILQLCGRPFSNIDHMNEELIRRHNSVVAPEDTVYVLGDIALGAISESLPLVTKFNGRKILVPGNHDRIASFEKASRIERFYPYYADVFDEITDEVTQVSIDMIMAPFVVNLSHYPYDGDSHGEDRYAELRAVDNGMPLIHGHTHGPRQKATLSKAGTPMFHVGQDAWEFYPVPESEIANWLEGIIHDRNLR